MITTPSHFGSITKKKKNAESVFEEMPSPFYKIC